MTPILAKCGRYHYQQIVMSQLSIKNLTALARWNTVYHSIPLSLNTIWRDHQLFYFLQGCCNFPGRSFYYHPSTSWKARKISIPPANSTPYN